MKRSVVLPKARANLEDAKKGKRFFEYDKAGFYDSLHRTDRGLDTQIVEE